jgi:dolichol-phosphate mannosyltransferase
MDSGRPWKPGRTERVFEMDLSILLPTYNEAGNIGDLIKEIKKVAGNLGIEYEIIVADGQSTDNTAEEVKKTGVQFFVRSVVQFSAALREGFPRCNGDYIIMLDTDFSHPPKYIADLWIQRNDADVIVCSRYIEGGGGEMTAFRKNLSMFFNGTYKLLLGIDATDLNCSYRLYNSKVVKKIKLDGKESEVYPELLCKAILSGYKIKDIPFHYEPRRHGKSTLKFFKYGKLYGLLLLRLIAFKIKTRRLRPSV